MTLKRYSGQAFNIVQLGRVIRQGQPQFNATGSPAGMRNPTVTTYDAIGRKVRVDMPDGTDIVKAFSINSVENIWYCLYIKIFLLAAKGAVFYF